jgi:isoamylase
MDSLRLWATVYGVDGFRFDLAADARPRVPSGFNPRHAFFNAILQDPVLGQVKLIAEPWDVGPGRLPARQLPGRLLRVERRLSRRGARILAGRARSASCRAFAARFAASSDLFNEGRRRPVVERQLRHRP